MSARRPDAQALGPIARLPSRELRAVVRRYHGFREVTPGPMRRVEGPGADIVVVLSFGHEWRIGSSRSPARPFARHTSFLAGMDDASVLTEHDGHAYGMQLSLTPPGAYALLGLPMHELTGRTVELNDVLGKQGDLLVEQLAELGDWDARFALLDTTLGSWSSGRAAPSPAVVWAWRRLVATRGGVPIGHLANELGWGRKRLVARFREQVGLPPKAVARLLRFERAIDLLDGRSATSMAEVALGAGYYDQSHFSNEIRRITGLSPTALREGQTRETSFQDRV